MSGARVTAFLGMDITGFQAGLDKANGSLERFKRALKTGDVGNGIRQMLGAGAIIQAFRLILNSAQDLRKELNELGAPVDAATASVSAYADRWDQIKTSIRDAGISALGFFTSTGRKLGEMMGTGSSDAEFEAIEKNKEAQKQTEKDLKANEERIDKETKSAAKQLGDIRRTNALAEMDDRERVLFIEQEINDLYEKRNELAPQSLSYIQTSIDLEKKIADLHAANDKKTNAQNAKNASQLAGAHTPFGMTVADVSKGAKGGRSERERRADQIMELENKGKAAERSGNYRLAASLKSRSAVLAGRAGFGLTTAGVGDIERGDNIGGGSGSWDARWGGMMAERNDRLKNGAVGREKEIVDKQKANLKWAIENAENLKVKKIDTGGDAGD